MYIYCTLPPPKWPRPSTIVLMKITPKGSNQDSEILCLSRVTEQVGTRAGTGSKNHSEELPPHLATWDLQPQALCGRSDSSLSRFLATALYYFFFFASLIYFLCSILKSPLVPMETSGKIYLLSETWFSWIPLYQMEIIKKNLTIHMPARAHNPCQILLVKEGRGGEEMRGEGREGEQKGGDRQTDREQMDWRTETDSVPSWLGWVPAW